MTTQPQNQNTHPDNIGIPQFCLFTFNFCIPMPPIWPSLLRIYDAFLQNKPNLPENQVNRSSVLAKGYEADIVFWPKNPKANFRKAKTNVILCRQKNYENKTLLWIPQNKAKTNPI